MSQATWHVNQAERLLEADPNQAMLLRAGVHALLAVTLLLMEGEE